MQAGSLRYGSNPMNIADELAKLETLRSSGALSREEFDRAKGLVLGGATAAPLQSAAAPNPPRAPVASPPAASTKPMLKQPITTSFWAGVFCLVAAFSPAGAWIVFHNGNMEFTI